MSHVRQDIQNRMVIVTTDVDQGSEKWTVSIQISHHPKPSGFFTTQQEAEDFGLDFANSYIDQRTG